MGKFLNELMLKNFVGEQMMLKLLKVNIIMMLLFLQIVFIGNICIQF